MAASPAAPAGPPRPVPPNPSANRKVPLPPGHTPTSGNPVLDDPKNKHLQKAKPPALDHRGGSQAPNLGDTDPSLRKYQDRRANGGGAMKILLAVTLVILALVIAILFIRPVRDAVRPYFPGGIQKLLMDEPASAPVTAPVPTSAVVPVAVPGQVPATAPAAVTTEPKAP